MSQSAVRPLLALLLAVLLSMGCTAWFPAASGREAPALEGWTYFPANRVQAVISEVAGAATVSLIDPVASQTLATSLTDAAGRFRLGFAGFRPAKQLYILEAIKGLQGNAVGQDTARIRTLIAWNGAGWVSLTSALPDSPVVLDASTTALCITQSLRQGGAHPVEPMALIGSLVTGPTPTFAPGESGVSGGEFTQVRSMVLTVLLNDLDPIDAVILLNGSYAIKPGLLNQTPVILSGVSPDSASVGLTVTLLGQGFATNPAASTVSFTPGRIAPVLTASDSALTVRVPTGATTGPLALETNGIRATVSFTVLPLVSGNLKP